VVGLLRFGDGLDPEELDFHVRANLEADAAGVKKKVHYHEDLMGRKKLIHL
jgi:hypothetical protein